MIIAGPHGELSSTHYCLADPVTNTLFIFPKAAELNQTLGMQKVNMP